MRLATIVKIVVVLVAALVATAIAALMSLDFGRYKGELASFVEQQTGRRLVIDGDFHLSPGLRPTVSVERLRLANAPWSSRPDMASIERLRVEVRLLPLLLGRLRIERLVLEGADILLETDAQGRHNWQFAAAAPASQPPPAEQGLETAPPSLPSFDRVRVERARIVWRDAQANRADEVTINSFEAQADSPDAPVAVVLRALYGGAPIRLEAMFGPLGQLAAPAAPWPFDLTAEAGGASIAAKGTIREPLAARGVDATLSVEGDDLSALGSLAGRAMPAVGPYRLATRVGDEDSTWKLRGLAVSVGQSSIAGDAALDLAQEPVRVRATLAAPLVDLADFIGRKRAARAAAPGQARPPAVPAPTSDGRIFPDDPLPVDLFAAFDAEIELRVARLVADGFPLADVAVDARIEDGALTAAPVSAKLAGAPLEAELRFVPGEQGAASLAGRLDARWVDVAALLKAAGKPPFAAGRVDVVAHAEGKGASVRGLMGALSGKLDITMGQGTIADGTLDLLSADVLKAISPWAPRRTDLRVNCMVGFYDIRSGVLRSRATLFDSDRVMLTGEGSVNLATEQIGFTVIPHAKKASLLQLAVPIRIGGTLAAPTAVPDAERMAKRAVGFVAGLPAAVGDKVVGTIGGLLGAGDGAKADNPCVVALRSGTDASRRPAAASSEPAPQPAQTGGPVENIGRTLEGIGKGIGEGLRNMFGR